MGPLRPYDIERILSTYVKFWSSEDADDRQYFISHDSSPSSAASRTDYNPRQSAFEVTSMRLIHQQSHLRYPVLEQILLTAVGPLRRSALSLLLATIDLRLGSQTIIRR